MMRPNGVRVESKNRAVLTLDDSHPAKRFVEAFIDCRMSCAGRELDLGGQVPIDQAWTSASDGRVWTFSGFIYAFICFDIELDGFLHDVPYLTPSEIAAARELPRLRSMMNECAEAGRQSGNSEILELTDQVLEMLSLWEQYLSFREKMISHAHD
jgi:hypothetical protein